MRKIAIVGLAGMLLIFIALTLPRHRGPAVVPATNLVVKFMGFINTTNGGHQAIFYFTNATPCTLHFQITSFDFKTDAGWESAPKTPDNFLPTDTLGPGWAISWPVDVDDTNVAWRLRIRCTERAMGLRDRGEEVVQAAFNQPTRVFSGRSYEIISSESK